jgi:hypothetical protein
MQSLSCSGWVQWDFHKKSSKTRYAKLVLLHLVGSSGHVVHSSASGVQNIEALFFMVGWDRYGFDKKRVETRYTKLMFLLPVGSADHVEQFNASGARNFNAPFFHAQAGPLWFP